MSDEWEIVGLDNGKMLLRLLVKGHDYHFEIPLQSMQQIGEAIVQACKREGIRLALKHGDFVHGNPRTNRI